MQSDVSVQQIDVLACHGVIPDEGSLHVEQEETEMLLDRDRSKSRVWQHEYQCSRDPLVEVDRQAALWWSPEIF